MLTIQNNNSLELNVICKFAFLEATFICDKIT